MFFATTFAVPAKRIWKDIQLKDGSSITVMLVGDEHGHWYLDKDGRALNIKDGAVQYLSTSELDKKKEHAQKRMTRANRHRIVKMARARKSSRQKAIIDERRPYTGKKRGLVILVNYSDKKLLTTSTKAVFEDQFNKVGYNKNGHVGSVHDYFYDQSYGIFDLEFDIVGPVTVSKKMAYYGQNDENGDDLHPCELVAEAVKLADKLGTDFSQYDWDGDGEVDQVYIIYAGYGEANAYADENTIWPHEWYLSEGYQYGDGFGAISIDGVKIDTYAISSELEGSSGSTMNGIGTACHEFSHCLGYPDLYNTNYDGGGGMSTWDLMHSGSYNGPNDNGEVPAGYTSYERWMAGWLDPIELSEPCFVKSMPALSDSPCAYIIYNNNNQNEAYMLENRQAKKWDYYIGGANSHGMLICHIDYDANAWYENTVNDDKNHQRMTYFPADNSFGTYYADYGYSSTFSQTAGDPFPGTKNKTSFTDTTTPAATLYNPEKDGRKFMGKPITDIAESNDGLISFTFMGGIKKPDTPKVITASTVNEGGFTAEWEPVADADTYSLRLYKYVAGAAESHLMLTEDFNGFTGTESGGDSSVAIDTNLDKFTNTKGWTGTKVYSSNHRVKIGSSKATGNITTPLLSAPDDGNVTVCADFTAYSASESGMTVSAIDANGKVYSSMTTTMGISAALGKNTIINLSDITGNFKIKFAPTKRGYVCGVKVYDGKYGINDIETSNSRSREPKQYISNDTIYVDGITDTSYAFTNLEVGTYRYSVKSVNSKAESPWSATAKVEIQPTGIIDIYADNVSKHNHSSRIFNLNGQCLGRKICDLPAGIYIINGRKVAVK